MKTNIFAISILLACMIILCNCSGTQKVQKYPEPKIIDNHFLLTEISSDASYGYTEKNPIMVGGVVKSEGPVNERRFLNALSGPNGETIEYERTGSCCSFKTPNGFDGVGLLDRYQVTWDGQPEPIFLYINMYDYGELKAPFGLTIKK